MVTSIAPQCFAPLAVIATESTRVARGRRNGKSRMRFYTGLASITQSHASDVLAAVRDLVVAGLEVRVREGDAVYYPTISTDGVLVWERRECPTTEDQANILVVM